VLWVDDFNTEAILQSNVFIVASIIFDYVIRCPIALARSGTCLNYSGLTNGCGFYEQNLRHISKR
jgi:hypothetical protein